MIDFTVRVMDLRGKRRSLREAAPDEEVLREKLRQKGWFIISVVEAKPKGGLARMKIPLSDFVALLDQLEMQLRAGVTADAALAQLAEDAPAGNARIMLGTIHRNVARGMPIHEACRVFARQFPPHLAAVIAAGEASARLPEALHSLSENLASAAELRKTARRALIYPAMVLGATSALVVFLLGGVVPQFAAIFESLHLPLPAITVILIRASYFLRAYWPQLLVSLAVVGPAMWYAVKRPGLRYARDKMLLRLPIWGETIRCLCTARFAAHCRLLHEAGIPLLSALATGTELTNQAVLERQLTVARERVAAGQPLYAALPKKHDFPGFIIPALKSGETTGQLGAALRHIEHYAAARAKERLTTALALLEPLLLCGLTTVVGGIALSFFLPLFSLLGGLNAR